MLKLFPISQRIVIFRLTARSRDSAEAAINFYLSDMELRKNSAFQYNNTRSKPYSLVVDGKTLTFILDLR